MPFDLETIRRRLDAGSGKVYWRSLEELADTEEFRQMISDEFPEQAAEWLDPVTRRRFLALMGASFALAGVVGCSARPAPHEKIMPYVRQPEQLVPGRPLFFATGMSLAGIATGLLLESHEGRPTKVEGNPDHPGSLGATDVYSQASVLGLYDPDRSRSVVYRGRDRSWAEALTEIRQQLERQRADNKRGAGLRLLTETITSPSMGEQLASILKDFPEARWVQYDPANRDNTRSGARLAFNEDAHVYYDFSKADCILSLDADFLSCSPGHLRYTHDFTDRRRLWTQDRATAQRTMSRFYAVESAVTNTGLVADHRLALRPSQIDSFARALAVKLGVPDAPQPAAELPEKAAHWVEVIAEDLNGHRGTSLVIVGDQQPAHVHALVLAINDHLQNTGKTVLHTDPLEIPNPKPLTDKGTQTEELRQLVDEMNQGRVEALFILGVNPVYSAPVDLDFAKALNKVPWRLHLGLYQDETAVACDWHIPAAHYLESWGDARAYDGTLTFQQPLIEPLYGGRSAYEMLAVFSDYPERPGFDIVHDYWARQIPKEHFNRFWHEVLRKGFLDSQDRTIQEMLNRLDRDVRNRLVLEPRTRAVKGWAGRVAHEYAVPPGPLGEGELELAFLPDPTVYDGRFANNGWLQELPKPVTKLTWDNAAIISPATAEKLKLPRQTFGNTGGERGRAVTHLVKLTYRDRTLPMPLWVQPGQPDDVVTVHLGYGRERAGEVGGRPGGERVGFNVYTLRGADAPWFDRGLTLQLNTAEQSQPGGGRRKVADRYTLACTELHHLVFNRQAQEREPIHSGTLDEYHEDPTFAKFMKAGEELAPEIRALIPPNDDDPKAVPEGKEERHVDRRLVPLSLYDEDQASKKGYADPDYRWGMAIDLTACTGCSACVVACQAENNIPVVGKTEVTRGREMHWLRIDRYYLSEDTGGAQTLRDFQTFFQPVPCMHCEKAPCELVCPVAATVHSHDGLNDMVYNRCVGTRYCSNNCPYKVRRFNFLFYAEKQYNTPSLHLLQNPDVTVRSRGVMEKCTYCVQRIRAADIDAQNRIADRLAEVSRQRREGKISEEEAAQQRQRIQQEYRVRDGEVLTACQAACPASAIIFGDLNGPNSEGQGVSRVLRMKKEALNYALLAGLNTQPRTTYLAAVRNRNPKLLQEGHA